MHGSSADLFCCSLWAIRTSDSFRLYPIGERVILATVVLPQAAADDARYVTSSIGPVRGGNFN
jgi:hypothetical protein